MSLRFQLIWAGRHSPEPWESLSADYRKRIEGYVSIREQAVRAAPKPAFLVALDEQGALWTSEELARQVERWRAEWPHPVVFYLGSDVGLDPALLETCRLRLAFGRMTLPHHLARLVLLEQLYRALSIVAGINYHRATLK